jgi:hypothetical protein
MGELGLLGMLVSEENGGAAADTVCVPAPTTLLPRQNVGHRMRALVAERSLCKHGGFFLISLSFTLRFPYTFYVLATLILFLGVSAITVMPMDIFPEINIPVVSVIWRYTA